MKIGLLVVVLGLARVQVGCGGDDNGSSAASTEEWAEGYCAAIVDWLGELEQATGELRDFRSLSQEAFDEAGSDIRSATEDLTTELRGLGAPDTDFGEEARQTVDTFATSAEADLADIEQSVEDVFGGTSISDAIVSVTAALTSINKAYTAMFDSLRKIDREKELQTALEGAESCDDLGGGG
jgi:hypothetical protein